MRTVFLRAIESEDKGATLREAIRQPRASTGKTRFEVDVKDFAVVPGTPFAYWVSDRVRALFRELPPFEGEGRTAKQGLATADDFRFVRLWTEVEPSSHGERWFPFAKGARSSSPYYGTYNFVVEWSNSGEALREFVEPHSGRQLSRPQNIGYYFKPGITWVYRTPQFCGVVMPRGTIPSNSNQAIFAEADTLASIICIVNSKPFDYLIKLMSGRTGSGTRYSPGMVGATPYPLRHGSDNYLNEQFPSLWHKTRMLDSVRETSLAFLGPALLWADGSTLAERANRWDENEAEVRRTLAHLQQKLDQYCFRLYGFSEAEGIRVEMGFGVSSRVEKRVAQISNDAEGMKADSYGEHTASLISWCVGVAFGRFDKAKVHEPPPPEPDPFDPLPAFSPGMRQASNDGEGPDDTGGSFPAILTDDPGSSNDLLAQVLDVLQYVIDNTDLDEGAIEEAAAILDPKEGDLRKWLAREFFPYHIKKYSMSRRKAPIYWQLSVPSRRYSVWLYYHALNRNTLYTVLTDHVEPKLEHEERRLAEMVYEAGDNPTAAQRRQIAEQEDFVTELREFREEIFRVAPLWHPRLDDGVVINFAPLWRLVPHERSWRRECKGHWDKLTAGDYDWSHWAMHLWPERVVPKCAQDLSFAIAHGLDKVLWRVDEDGKRVPIDEAAGLIESLIKERTSPAVKDALQQLLAAPRVGGGTVRTAK